METKLSISSSLLLLCVIMLTLSCNDDDGDGPTDMNNPYQTCCDLPAYQGTVGDSPVYIPNIFTPNNDGVNDLFGPYTGSGITNIVSFNIFDGDAGILIGSDLSPNDPSGFWDGTFGSDTILRGTFVYTITFETISGLTETVEGTVCVIPCGVEDSDLLEDLDGCLFPDQQTNTGTAAPDVATNDQGCN